MSRPNGNHEIGRGAALATSLAALILAAAAGVAFFVEDNATVALTCITIAAIFFGAAVPFRPVVNRWLRSGGEFSWGGAIGRLPPMPESETEQPKAAAEPSQEPAASQEDSASDSTEKTDETPARPERDAVIALIDRDRPLFESKMREAIEKSTGEDNIRYRAMYLYGLDQFGDESAFQGLVKLNEENPNSHWPLRQMALALVAKKEHEQAAKYYRLARQCSGLTEAQKVDLLGGEVDALLQMNRFDEAVTTVDDVDASLGDDTERNKLHRLRGQIYRSWGRHEDADRELETYLTFSPSDHDARFKLAYSYSERNFAHLAVHHYELISVSAADSMADNNLGIELLKFDLPIHAVQKYKQAARKEVTLAYTNIASQLAEQGFVQEARDWLDDARKKRSPHRRIESIATWISQLEAREDETHAALLGETRRIREIYLRSFDRGWEVTPAQVAGRWATAAFGEIVLTFEGKKVEGKFKEDSIWNWTLTGQLDGHTLKVTWEADHWLQEHKGAGYLVFAADARAFEGVLQGTPKPPRARIVEGTKVG